MHPIILIAKLTFVELRKNRWILFVSTVFAALILSLSTTGSSSMRGVAGFDRLSATVLNMVLLFVPLVGFLMGAQLFAADRENGALAYLLSHPVRKRDVYLGKTIGAFSVLSVAFSIGFGVAALFVAFFTFDGLRNFLLLWVFSLLFSFLCLMVGTFISSFSANRTRAIGLSLFGWLVFTMLGDLGLMSTSFMLNLDVEQVVALVLLNPLETFKVLMIKMIATNLEVLGTGGLYFDKVLGSQMIPFLMFWLIFVTCFFLLSGMWIFVKQEET